MISSCQNHLDRPAEAFDIIVDVTWSMEAGPEVE